MDISAIIQARMGSTRLPGKVLEKIGGKKILDILVDRLRTFLEREDIIVATSEKKENDKIQKFCEDREIKFFRGSEDNVLQRYIDTANKFKIDTIIRVTADNPLTSPYVIKKLTEVNGGRFEYTYPKNVPIGTGVEVVKKSALQKIKEKKIIKNDREHVTAYIRKNPSQFRINEFDFGRKNFRLTVDTPKDLALLRKIDEIIGPIEKLSLDELISFLGKNPRIASINQDVNQNHYLIKKRPEISVIIRSYNSEKNIEKAIKSTLNQTLEDPLYEVLVVDDGSEDDTKEKIRKYSKKLRIIEKQHTGPINSLNKGIKEAKGNYIIILDSDDSFTQKTLEKMYKVIEITKNVSFVHPDYYEEIGENKKYVSTDDNILNSVAGGILFKKEDIVKLGFFNENLIFPEYDLLLKMVKKGLKKIHMPQPLYIYHRRNNSITSSKEKVKKGKKELEKKWGRKLKIRTY